jgi:ribosomal protein S18 acetylase RimI-like enzyme
MTGFGPDEITIRRIGAEDWALWRQLRLKALEEAPYAFSARLADWQGEHDTEARWRQRLSDVPFNLVAEFQKTAAGMVSGTAVDSAGSVELISMWVAPFARGQGVADALVRAVIGWARGQRASRVSLGVREGNDAAEACYRRHGFVAVGGGTTNQTERGMIHDLSQDSR